MVDVDFHKKIIELLEKRSASERALLEKCAEKGYGPRVQSGLNIYDLAADSIKGLLWHIEYTEKQQEDQRRRAN